MTLPKPITVLIADDDHWVTRGLISVLDVTEGMRVLGAVHTASGAIAAYREEPADVVLMDLNMGPGITGVDAIIEIIREFPDARILVLTTAAPGPGLVRALHVGAIATLSKSASQVTLVETIRSAALGENPNLIRGLVADVLAGNLHEAVTDELPPSLTTSELRILQLICEGVSYVEIAARLCVSPSTVETHAKHLRQKLNARSLAQLVIRALEYCFVSS